MAAARMKSLKKHGASFLDHIHPDTDIPTIMGLIGLNADKRHYVMAESGIVRKWRFFDHLLQSLGDVANWDILIGYLLEGSRVELADTLIRSLAVFEQYCANVGIQQTLTDDTDKVAYTGTGTHAEQRPQMSQLEEFSVRLAEYYQLNYTNIPTMGESPKHVKDVWVPMQIDGRCDAHLKVDRINHVGLLSRLKSAEGRNVALIKGDPGIGKSTLAKKIAYDWAASYGTTNPPQFSLVLAVPLRSVGKSNRIDQLAIDYFLSIVDLEDIDKAKLTREIKSLKSQLLVILDGLDEYSGFSDSPFKDMFADQFQLSSAYSKATPQMIPFKLIITSRPYACERINEEFCPLKYAILPLALLGDFIRHYCQTAQAVEKVFNYLNSKTNLVIRVPLILSFICFLADFLEEIPTNTTSLYDCLIRQMVVREIRQGKLVESICIHAWKGATVVKTTSELAYGRLVRQGNNQYEFSSSHLDNSHVNNDSFICGFLLHKYDFIQQTLTAEFPHRSIQEFFVALHCYHLMLTGRTDVLSQVITILYKDENKENLVIRFFLGICSKEGRFQQMINWLNPSLLYNLNGDCQPTNVINRFGIGLSDCPIANHRTIGQILFKSVRDLDSFVINSLVVYSFIDWYSLDYSQFSDDFINALHLGICEPADNCIIGNWFLVGKRRSAKLVYIYGEQPVLEERMKRFKRIDFLIIKYRPYIAGCTRFVDKIKSLPLIRNLVLATNFGRKTLCTSVVFCIRYGCKSGQRLTNFRFEYKHRHRDELIGFAENDDNVNLTVDEATDSGTVGVTTFRRMNVTVNERVCQSKLLFALIRLSLLQKKIDLTNRHIVNQCSVNDR